MSIGRRLYDLLRANALHYLRGEDEGAGAGGWRRVDADPGPWDPGSAGTRDAAPPSPPATDRLRKAYGALELPYGAGPDEVRAAHRALMRRYHPDRFARDPDRLADATRLSQRLTEARDLLLEALARGEIRPPADRTR